jgi:flavodoxin
MQNRTGTFYEEGYVMKYAVLYVSETGNTKKVANEVYAAIDFSNKEIVDLKTEAQIPQADIYFVGFPIHQKNCGMKIVDALEQIETGKVALFATCGLKPTEKYKQKLEDSLSIWLSDDAEYLGLYLCQGKTTEAQKKAFYDSNPEYRDKLREMLEEGNTHPDEEDLESAAYYVKRVLQ